MGGVELKPAKPETLKEARRADRVAARSTALADLVETRRVAEAAIASTVAGLRRDGVSWRRIADLMGKDHVSVYQRYGPPASTRKR